MNVLILHATQEKTAFRLSRRHVASENEQLGRETDKKRQEEKAGYAEGEEGAPKLPQHGFNWESHGWSGSSDNRG